MKKIFIRALVMILACGFFGTISEVNSAETEQSLVSFSSGALIVQKPAEYSESWSAFWMLDEKPDSGWASSKGKIENNVVVIELAEKALLKRLEFDTGRIDGKGRGAKDIIVEISDEGQSSGFKKIASVSLVDMADKQSFNVSVKESGRWLRLTIKNNHGAVDYTELMDFRAYGSQLTKSPFPDASGTYGTNYNDFHMRQQGTSTTGCYEYNKGVLTGGIEGRIMKITWREGERKGLAVMVFSRDGKQFFGLWWHEGNENQSGKIWNGTLKSREVGSCPHWAGGAQEQMTKDLAEFGRVRVYGINFDVNSAVIRDESKPTLDKIVAMLKADVGMKLIIEGHTDSTGTAEQNQVLSQKRAESVKAYLIAAGVSSGRLSAVGFGASKPVASNSTDMGKAQNRRVELVKK
jgi:outer membrane protein OmpA-like peptidoglycan-associated protein